MDLEMTWSAEAGVLKLEGNWTIERAGELKAALLEAVNNSEHIVIDLGELTDTDLSAVQLLCSAHRTSARMGKRLALGERKPETLIRVVRDAGLRHTIRCHQDTCKSCLWTGDWTS